MAHTPKASKLKQATINTPDRHTADEPKLPHERDEDQPMTDQTDSAPPVVGKRGHADLKRGLIDPDARAADGRPKGDARPTR